jgi:hypothetical protein
MPSSLFDSLIWSTLTLGLNNHVHNGTTPETLGFCHRIANEPLRPTGFFQLSPMRLAGAVGLLLGIIIARWRQRRIVARTSDVVGGVQDTEDHIRALGEAVMRRPSSAHHLGNGGIGGAGSRNSDDMKQSLLGDEKHAYSSTSRSDGSGLPPSDDTPSGLIARTEESAEQMAKTWAQNAHYFSVHRWALNWTIVSDYFTLCVTLVTYLCFSIGMVSVLVGIYTW